MTGVEITRTFLTARCGCRSHTSCLKTVLGQKCLNLKYRLYPKSGAQPSPILAEETGEVRTQGEISRESTKTPDEVSREALDSARETEEQAQEDVEEAA